MFFVKPIISNKFQLTKSSALFEKTKVVTASDYLVLAFDAIFNVVMNWEPISAGASVHTVVFTNKKAWMIIKPMAKCLDVKFYNHEPIDSDLFTKITEYKGKYAHHLRLKDDTEINDEIIELIRIGWKWGMNA